MSFSKHKDRVKVKFVDSTAVIDHIYPYFSPRKKTTKTNRKVSSEEEESDENLTTESNILKAEYKVDNQRRSSGDISDEGDLLKQQENMKISKDNSRSAMQNLKPRSCSVSSSEIKDLSSLSKPCSVSLQRLDIQSSTPHRLRKRVLRKTSDDESSSSSNEESDEEPSRPSDNSQLLDEENYFDTQSSRPNITSNNTLSRLAMPKMDRITVNKLLATWKDPNKKFRDAVAVTNCMGLNEWKDLLQYGFNILVYGYGSKVELIAKFVNLYLDNEDVVVVNGYFPGLTLNSILSALYDDYLQLNNVTGSNMEIATNIVNHLAKEPQEIYMVVHNLDGAMLRSTKSQNVLAILATSPSIHFIVSIDHINAEMLWDQTRRMQFNFLQYHMPTYEPYVIETSYENSLVTRQSGQLALSSLVNVYKSLTPNAQKIFMFLLERQMENKENSHYTGLPIDKLYSECRDRYWISNNLALHTQLTEYRNHLLIKSKKGLDGAECLRIPLPHEMLQEFKDQHSDL